MSGIGPAAPKPFQGYWNCAICGQRRRGMGWGKQLAKRTAFLRWEVTGITAQWLDAGARICWAHESAEQLLEQRRKIVAFGDSADPELLAQTIAAIERILEAGPPA